MEKEKNGMMKEYVDLLEGMGREGVGKEEGRGRGRMRVLGDEMGLNVEEGFGVVRRKKVELKWMMDEVVWLLEGDRKVKYVEEKGVRMWKEWGEEKGDLGEMYG